jgi:hypothetical protein
MDTEWCAAWLPGNNVSKAMELCLLQQRVKLVRKGPLSWLRPLWNVSYRSKSHRQPFSWNINEALWHVCLRKRCQNNSYYFTILHFKETPGV